MQLYNVLNQFQHQHILMGDFHLGDQGLNPM